MNKTPYAPNQIEMIQLNMIALLDYIKRIDKNSLPRAFEFCEIIIKNIDICREDDYKDIDELSKLIREDWKCAMESHSGLPEYYIQNKIFRIQSSVNEAISKQIVVIDKLISKITY